MKYNEHENARWRNLTNFGYQEHSSSIYYQFRSTTTSHEWIINASSILWWMKKSDLPHWLILSFEYQFADSTPVKRCQAANILFQFLAETDLCIQWLYRDSRRYIDRCYNESKNTLSVFWIILLKYRGILSYTVVR